MVDPFCQQMGVCNGFGHYRCYLLENDTFKRCDLLARVLHGFMLRRSEHAVAAFTNNWSESERVSESKNT